MTGMAKLRKAVFVKDPARSRTVRFLPGEEPEPRLAALVTNPDCWEDGKLPAAAEDSSQEPDETGKDSSSEDQPKAAHTAKKTAARKSAASRRSGGRDAADEGSSGE